MFHFEDETFWDMVPCSGAITLMMEAVITFVTSVSFYETAWQHIPEVSRFHTRRHGKVISVRYLFSGTSCGINVLMLIEGRTFITEALMGSNLTSKLYV
jgi:hypothetical protein